MSELGLFPLGLVLLPTERVPLHIFEDRYKELIGQCLEDSTEFGFVLATATGLQETGTRAEVVEVLDRYEDGRLDVVVEGRDPFRIVRMTEGHPYLTAEVEPLPAGSGAIDESAAIACIEAFVALAAAAGTEVTPPEIEGPPLSFRVAAQIELAVDLKQELLVLRDENERLTRLTEMLTDLAAIILHRRDVQRRAVGNGKVDNF